MNRRRDAIALLIAFVCFIAVRLPLFLPDGVMRGFNSDSAIIGLMGKKLLDGRGFDVFFWGQNYLGSLTSILTAAFGALVGEADPLALRLASFSEVAVGIVLIWWGVRRVDARVANLVAIALAISPPVLFRMSVNPYGAEMAFLLGAALFAFGMQHFGSDRGWLSTRAGQLAFGVLAGFSWWMNQQVVFTLLALGLVLGWRSSIFAAIRPHLRISDRLLLRQPMPGLLQATVRVLQVAGIVLLLIYIAGDISGRYVQAFVVSPSIDALALILGPQLLLPFLTGEWRTWRMRLPDPNERRELAALAIGAVGFAIGYAPVWLGRLLAWYEPSYVFHFSPLYPKGVAEQIVAFFTDAMWQWAGFAPLLILGAMRFRGRPEAARAFLYLIPLINVIFFFVASAKPHYLISSCGMALAIAFLGIVDTPRIARALLTCVMLGTLLASSVFLKREILLEPDPKIVLQRVEEQRCAVAYGDFWVAYHYRFLDGERIAWVPYLSQDRTREDTRKARALAGQRCMVGLDGRVTLMAGDPPIRRGPPSASPRPAPLPATR